MVWRFFFPPVRVYMCLPTCTVYWSVWLAACFCLCLSFLSPGILFMYLPICPFTTVTVYTYTDLYFHKITPVFLCVCLYTCVSDYTHARVCEVTFGNGQDTAGASSFPRGTRQNSTQPSGYSLSHFSLALTHSLTFH